MNVEYIDAETGTVCVEKAQSVSNEFIQLMMDFDMSGEQIKRIIDNLDVSADAKDLLYKISKATIKVGDYILKIGRKIIDYICTVFRENKNAGFGLIFGAIAGVLISAIPLIGALIGPLVTPLLMIFGLVGGLNEDLKDKALERKIREIVSKFSPLKAA